MKCYWATDIRLCSRHCHLEIINSWLSATAGQTFCWCQEMQLLKQSIDLSKFSTPLRNTMRPIYNYWTDFFWEALIGQDLSENYPTEGIVVVEKQSVKYKLLSTWVYDENVTWILKVSLQPPSNSRTSSFDLLLSISGYEWKWIWFISLVEILNKDQWFSAELTMAPVYGSRTSSVTQGHGLCHSLGLACSSWEAKIMGWILNDGGSLSS